MGPRRGETTAERRLAENANKVRPSTALTTSCEDKTRSSVAMQSKLAE